MLNPKQESPALSQGWGVGSGAKDKKQCDFSPSGVSLLPPSEDEPPDRFHQAAAHFWVCLALACSPLSSVFTQLRREAKCCLV